MLLLVLITPFTVHSQNQAVHEVYAKAQNDAVDLVWSFDDIIHETMVVDFETADFTQAPFETDQTFPWLPNIK